MGIITRAFLFSLWILLLTGSSLQANYVFEPYSKLDNDSLEQLLTENISVSGKVDILNKLAERYIHSQADKTLSYSQQALSLSTNIDHPAGQAKSKVILGRYNHFIRNDYKQAIFWYSEGLNQYRELGNLKKEAIAYVLLALSYEKTGEVDLCMESYHCAIGLYQELGDLRGQAGAWNNMGNISSWKGNYDAAMDYFQQSIKACQDLGNLHCEALAIDNLGQTLVKQASFHQALKANLDYLKIAEQLSEPLMIAGGLEKMGTLFLYLEDYDKAIEKYEAALILFREHGEPWQIAQILNDIGLYYAKINREQQALKHFREALELVAEDQVRSVPPLSNLGDIYFERGEYTLAMNTYKKVKRLGEQHFNDRTISWCLAKIGKTHAAMGKFDQAIDYYLRGVDLATQNGNINLLDELYAQLNEAYTITGQFEKANHYLQLYVEVNDSIMNIEKNRQIREMEAKYEYEHHQKAIEHLHAKTALLEKENEIHLLQIEKTNYLIIILVITLALILLAFLMIVLFWRQHKIKSREKTILLRQKLLRLQMNPHFIFNFLASIQGYIYEKKPAEAADYLSDFANLIRLYLENSRHEFISLKREINGLKYYLNLQKLLLKRKFSYEIAIDPEINQSDFEIPPMLAQPFIENALEHGISGSDQHGKIMVQFQLRQGQLFFEVQDNGTGIPQQKPVISNGHESLAIKITQERLDILNRGKKVKISMGVQEMINDSREIKGTKISFRIPYKKVS